MAGRANELAGLDHNLHGAMMSEGESQSWVRHRLRISPFLSALKAVRKVSAIAVGRII